MTDSAPPSSMRAPAWRAPALLGLILLAAAATRFYKLGASALWIDEATSVALARMPWTRFLKTLWEYEANMSLYYLLLRGWMHFGTSEAALRSLSALAGVAGVAAIFFLGRKLLSTGAGLLAAALLAVHMQHIWGSQEVRTYGLVVLLLVLSTHLFVNAVESRRDASRWIAYVVVSALAVYAHVYAVLILAAHWVALGERRAREVGLRRIMIVGASLGVLISPMGLFVLLRDQGQLSWIRNLFTAGQVVFTILIVNGMNPLLVILLLIALFRVGRGIGQDDDAAWNRRLLAAWFVFPIVLLLVVSIWKPIFFFRYFVICAPAAVLLGASELTRPRPATRLRFGLRIAVSVLTVAITAMVGIGYLFQGGNFLGDWRSATEYILANSRPGDAAVFDVTAGLDAFRYYQDRVPSAGRASIPVTVYPSPDELASAHHVPTAARLREAVKSYERVWVVLNLGSAQDAPVNADMLGAFHVAGHQLFGRAQAGPTSSVNITLYERNAP